MGIGNSSFFGIESMHFKEFFGLRIALLLLSLLLFILMPFFLPNDAGVYLIAFYSVLACLIACLALFGHFSKRIKSKKMREDIEIPPATADTTVSRDYRKDFVEKENLLKFMFEVSSDGLWEFDLATGKVTWSEHAAEACGIGKDLGDSFEVLKGAMLEKDRGDFLKALPEALAQNKQFGIETRIFDAFGKERLLLLCGKPQLNEEGRAIRMVGRLSDVTDMRRAERNLFYSAFHDPLTGAKNRQFFLDRVRDEISRSEVRPDYLFAVILLDIDHFTAVNDSFSHQVGDKLLRIVSDRISEGCRQNDVVARINGDVFGIILRNIEGRGTDTEVKAIVRRLQDEIRMPFSIDGHEILITVSMAVIFNREFKDVESLLANADTMLREAKRVGIGGIQFFASGMREKAMELYKLEMEIRKAIQSCEFMLMYQPIVDIFHGNRVTGFEALVRWNNTERGIVSPADFIPMAEETGLIVPMGELILRMACKQMKEWVDLGYRDLTCAVNFSAKQFALDNMVSEVQRILLETHLDPHNLKLEVTEYTAMSEVEKTIGIMEKLADMGIQISIDDFGTGYSSLMYLKRYPIRTLKIDSSFVRDIPKNAEDVAIVKMVIGMAKSLGLDLIAEGVERKDQLDFLYKEGCQYIQGFYFSRPLAPAEAFRTMAESRVVKNAVPPNRASSYIP